MDRFYIIAALISTCVIGAIRINMRINRVAGMRFSGQEYLNRLGKYISSRGRDTESYGWLTQKSVVMQRQLGDSGVLAAYRPPFANFQYQNYPVLLNMLPDLRNAFAEAYALERLANQYGSTLQEVMIRHLGEVDFFENEQRKQSKNAFIWLREGFRTVLSSPLYLLQWFGLLSETATNRLIGNVLFRIFTSFAVLVGFIGSVVSIVVGWDQFAEIISGCLNSPHLKLLKKL